MEYANLICVILSIGMLLWMVIFDVRNSVTQFVTLIVLLLSNFGYYLLGVSESLGEAILALKISYIGGMFLPLFYFILVSEICHIKLPRWFSSIAMLIQLVGYGFVCTVGRGTLYYESVDIYTKNGMTFINRVYGPLHIICPLTMAIYLVMALGLALYSVSKNISVNRRGVLTMVSFAALAVATYFVEKYLLIDYEIIPIADVILMFGTLFPIYDSNIFTSYENTEIIEEQLEAIGFLTFDTKRRYRGCDEFMRNVFPELLELRVGQKIDKCSENLQKIIDQVVAFEGIYIRKYKKNHAHVSLESFKECERYYSGKIHALTNIFGELKGYTIELRDDTEHFQALQLREHYNDELTREVDEKTKRIRFIQQKIILGMAQMVESRDMSTGGHIKRTSDVVRIFAKKLKTANLGLNERFLRLVIRSAPMHDLGKIGVDDYILRKEGRFDEKEYSIMKKHSEIGYHMVTEILSEVEEPDFVSVAQNVAHYHHEKIDGTGYPDGLKGDEIPIEARIMALADVFDALVSKRCYKEAFSYDRAFEIIEHDSGTHFDEKLAKVFISCRPMLEEYYNNSQT